MILNKIAAIALLIIIIFIIRIAARFKVDGVADYGTKINLYGGAILLFLLAIGFLTTNKPFCELVPFFCR